MGIFMLAACNDEKKEAGSKMVMNDLATENLKGDISSIEESPYKTDSTGKAGEMDSCCISITDFDANGYNSKNVSKDSKGKVSEESVFSHHPNGLFKSSSSSKNGKSSGGFNTEVDAKGNYTFAWVIDSNGKNDIYYTNIAQNDLGQVTGWKQYDKDSVFRQSGESKYDKNLQTAFTLKDSVGKVKFSSSNKYNDKGELIEESTSNTKKSEKTGIDSTTNSVTKYTYDSHDEMDNWTQRTKWDDKGKATAITKRTYTYRKK